MHTLTDSEFANELLRAQSTKGWAQHQVFSSAPYVLHPMVLTPPSFHRRLPNECKQLISRAARSLNPDERGLVRGRVPRRQAAAHLPRGIYSTELMDVDVESDREDDDGEEWALETGSSHSASNSESVVPYALRELDDDGSRHSSERMSEAETDLSFAYDEEVDGPLSSERGSDEASDHVSSPPP